MEKGAHNHDMSNTNKVVCVTGSEGFVGSYLVYTLLENGYTVHATVQDTDKAKFLLEFPNANQQLKIFKADLMDDGSFDQAIHGCHGVFHLASPVLAECKDPKREVIECAVRGVLNVLRSSEKSNTVKRIVHTSSIVAATLNNSKEDTVNESWWTVVDNQFEDNFLSPYTAAKTLAEKTAWDWVKQSGTTIELVTILPTLVCGPWKCPGVPLSIRVAMSVFTQDPKLLCVINVPTVSFVHVQDLCNAQILLMESPDAQGRHICCGLALSLTEFLDFLRHRYPQYQLLPPEKCHSDTTVQKVSQEKLKKLSFEFQHDDLDKIYRDMVDQFAAVEHLTPSPSPSPSRQD